MIIIYQLQWIKQFAFQLNDFENKSQAIIFPTKPVPPTDFLISVGGYTTYLHIQSISKSCQCHSHIIFQLCLFCLSSSTPMCPSHHQFFAGPLSPQPPTWSLFLHTCLSPVLLTATRTTLEMSEYGQAVPNSLTQVQISWLRELLLHLVFFWYVKHIPHFPLLPIILSLLSQTLTSVFSSSDRS